MFFLLLVFCFVVSGSEGSGDVQAFYPFFLERFSLFSNACIFDPISLYIL